MLFLILSVCCQNWPWQLTLATGKMMLFHAVRPWQQSGHAHVVSRGEKHLLADYLQQRELTSPGSRDLSFPLAEENPSHFNGVSSANASSRTTPRSTPGRGAIGLLPSPLLWGKDCCSGRPRNRTPGNALDLEPLGGRENPCQDWPFKNKTRTTRNCPHPERIKWQPAPSDLIATQWHWSEAWDSLPKVPGDTVTPMLPTVRPQMLF